MRWYWWLVILIVLVLVIWGGYKLYANAQQTNMGTGASVSIGGRTFSTGIAKNY